MPADDLPEMAQDSSFFRVPKNSGILQRLAMGTLLGLGSVWAFPNTMLGLLWAVGARSLGGGGWQVVAGVLEVHGPGVEWVFNRFPAGRNVAAITLGQVVLARTLPDLIRTRRHERVHVSQYFRWGPFFMPAYGLSSIWVWAKGGDPYRGNRFEVEAYAIDDCQGNRNRSSSPTPQAGTDQDSDEKEKRV